MVWNFILSQGKVRLATLQNLFPLWKKKRKKLTFKHTPSLVQNFFIFCGGFGWFRHTFAALCYV